MMKRLLGIGVALLVARGAGWLETAQTDGSSQRKREGRCDVKLMMATTIVTTLR
jgi:hypothetical protein